MNLRQAGIRTLLLAAAAALTSCIDSREEYWLEADGGGRAEATYCIPSAVAAMHGGESGIRELIDGFLKRTPEITSSACEVATEGKSLRVEIHAGFKSALDLKNVTTGNALKELPSAASNLAGKVMVDLQGRTLDFQRHISVSDALPGSSLLPDSRFNGHRMVYIMHLPAAATDSNATRTEDSGRTLIWEIPLAHALKSPITTRFKMEVPIPWTLVALIALPVSLVCGLAVRRIRASRKRVDQPPRPVGV